MKQENNTHNASDTALLSSDGDMTSFRFADLNIRFKTPSRLKRYTEVKEWNDGYIVATAIYDGIGETEEYIDLLPILKNLCINADEFLKPIKYVSVSYDRPQAISNY